jgi:hypothetical protein
LLESVAGCNQINAIQVNAGNRHSDLFE